MTETTAEVPRAARGHASLQWQILAGFVLGLAAGLAVYAGARDADWVATVVTYVTQPIGQVFLRLLFVKLVALHSL